MQYIHMCVYVLAARLFSFRDQRRTSGVFYHSSLLFGDNIFPWPCSSEFSASLEASKPQRIFSSLSLRAGFIGICRLPGLLHWCWYLNFCPHAWTVRAFNLGATSPALPPFFQSRIPAYGIVATTFRVGLPFCQTSQEMYSQTNPEMYFQIQSTWR